MTTDRHDPDATPELSDEFWGEQTEWTPQRRPSAERRGLGAAIGQWWDGLLGGGVSAERAHGRIRTVESPPENPDRATDPRQSVEEDDDNDAWTFEPEPQPERRGGVDPLIARLGGLAVIITLAAPVVVGFTTSGDDAASSESPPVAIAGATPDSVADASAAPTDAAPTAAPIDPATATEPPSPASETGDPSPSASASEAGPVGSDAIDPTSASAASLDATTDLEPAETTPACGARYELAAGDYWIRLADAAGVELSELLAVNDSSVDTVLVPGRTICLPVGAETPAPPTTAPPAPTPTAAPSTAAANRTPTTTAAPAPTTTAPSRPAAVPQSQAAQIIRDVWPDDLEDRALEIAWRESNHRSNVNNSCCYGLFQIHWTAHRSWLATIGVTSATQLYDPTVNATAALTLYQRSGGFGPWGG